MALPDSIQALKSTLQQRILVQEHRLFPMALRWAVEGRITVQGRRARIDLKPGESRALFG